MRKPAGLRRAEIAASVLTLADRLGPDRVTTGAVASAIGVTHAAFFRHFPTKAAMWQFVAEHIVENMMAAWENARVEHAAPLERLTGLITAQLSQIAATPALPMLLFSRELNVENKVLREAFRDALARYREHLVREISAGQKAGALRGDIAAGDLGLLLTSLVQGVAIRWALGARNFNLRDEGLRLFDVQLRLLAGKER